MCVARELSLELEQANMRVRLGCDWKRVRIGWAPCLAEPRAQSARENVRGAGRAATVFRISELTPHSHV